MQTFDKKMNMNPRDYRAVMTYDLAVLPRKDLKKEYPEDIVYM